ncbi:FlgT C-terminal domain-containing protein [Periweissella ghanensis]|uniref:Flagellar assembly protein T C-terminal domain-containing protein n=2 Tax=Periweissella ghanensis TaxID=467997 RepID=A0ABM8ZF93_9LACO|nr:FlgT C-terminal domain-containing protein [Periweissella ghanensis]CAH0419375.1 hypothetical protein WGH24286_01825 [Periweissella ghanensis]
MTEQLNGKVIRILSEKEIIINLGKSQGIQTGDEFIITNNYTEIVDPETNINYGLLYDKKDMLEVTRVFEKFCILSKLSRERIGNTINASFNNSFSSLKNIYGSIQITTEDLNVKHSQIDPMNSVDSYDTPIQIGDKAFFVAKI